MPSAPRKISLASMEPIETHTPKQLAARMPGSAKSDLLEWTLERDPSAYLATVVTNEVPVEKPLDSSPDIRITDDDPLNEYFLLRWWGLF